MDPYLNSRAFQILAETAAQESDQHPDRQPVWDKKLRHQIGGLLVTIGHRMQASGALFDDIACPPLEDEMHPSH